MEEQGLEETLRQVDPRIEASEVSQLVDQDGLQLRGREATQGRGGQQDGRSQESDHHGDPGEAGAQDLHLSWQSES